MTLSLLRMAQAMSNLAGAEDDMQTLLNLSPEGLQSFDTDVLCDKFELAISRRIHQGDAPPP